MRECPGPNGSRITQTHQAALPRNIVILCVLLIKQRQQRYEFRMPTYIFSFLLLLLPPSMTPPPTTSCQIECTRIESLPFIRMHSNMWVDSGMNGLLYVIGYCVCSNCGLWEIRSERPTSNGQIKRSSRFFFMHALCCAHELIGSMDANKIIQFFLCEFARAPLLFWHKFASMRGKRLIYTDFHWQIYRMGK